jgi:hypothetical protein
VSERNFKGRTNLKNSGTQRYWRIHNDKFSNALFDYLTAQGLAQKMERGNWFLVESKTAAIMMSYLAAAIANKTNSRPVTDRPTFIKAEDHLALVAGDKNRIRSHILEHVMPYPKTSKIREIVKFKETYSADMIMLRRNIEEVVETAMLIDNPANREHHLQNQIGKINTKKEELIARLKEKGFKNIITGAVKGMVVDIAIALFTGDVISPAGTLLGGGVEVVTELKQNPIKGEALSFLALIDQRL